MDTAKNITAAPDGASEQEYPYTREQEVEIIERSFDSLLRASREAQQNFVAGLRADGMADMADIYEAFLARRQQANEASA